MTLAEIKQQNKSNLRFCAYHNLGDMIDWCIKFGKYSYNTIAASTGTVFSKRYLMKCDYEGIALNYDPRDCTFNKLHCSLFFHELDAYESIPDGMVVTQCIICGWKSVVSKF